MFQRFASNSPRPNLRPACREASARREGGGLGWGKSCVCSASAMLKKMPRPYRAKRLGDTHATLLNREGISPFACGLSLGLGTWRAVQRTSLVREEKRAPVSLAMMDNTVTIHDENSEANRVEFASQDATLSDRQPEVERCHRRREQCLLVRYIIDYGQNIIAHHNQAVI